MRKIRVQVMSILLLISLLLTGCNGWKNYIHTESSLMWEAADALEEKYDEEFVIHEVWTMSQTMFYATCSPEDEQDIVFEAKVYKDGRGVYSDEYIQGAVAKQLEEKLQPTIEEVFGESFVKVTFALVEKPLNYYEGVSIEEYFELYEDEHLYIQIFVNKERNTQNQVMKNEFDCLSQLLAEEGILDAGCRCYFLDDEDMSLCRDNSKKNNYIQDSVLQDVLYFGFGYNEGVINKSYEEYVEIREEINAK